MKVNKIWLSWLLGITGALLLVFIGWEYDVTIISWLAFPILILVEFIYMIIKSIKNRIINRLAPKIFQFQRMR